MDRIVERLGDTNLRVVKAAQRFARLHLGRHAIPKRPQRPW